MFYLTIIICFILATEEDNTFLEEYLNSQRSDRRKAICQEIEKTMNTFKVNGLRMSLCHMRAELGGLNEHRLSDERLEEELNKPRGEVFLSKLCTKIIYILLQTSVLLFQVSYQKNTYNNTKHGKIEFRSSTEFR